MPDPASAPAPAVDLAGHLGAAYRSAMTGADAYRAVRAAVRLEHGTLRLGNRFVPVDRYREVAFVALGNASASLALAAWEALGERLTQGIIAGPSPPPSSVPFRSWELPRGLPGSEAALATGAAVLELAEGLGERDLLLVLLSPGALSALSAPPAGLTGPDWGTFLSALLEAGASGSDLARIARVARSGSTGGELARRAGAGEVETLVLDRGDGAALVGGGPTIPLAAEERTLARSRLAELGRRVAVPRAVEAALDVAPNGARRAGVQRPVVLLGPADALAGGSDALVDRRWTCRLAALSIAEPPEAAAQLLLARTEDIITELRGIPGAESFRQGSRDGPHGLAAFAGVTLGLPEGVREEEAVGRFLRAARTGMRRRGAAVALLPTAGAVGRDGQGAGGLVRADPSGDAEPERPFAMRSGLTDVGLLAAVLVPAAA